MRNAVARVGKSSKYDPPGMGKEDPGPQIHLGDVGIKYHVPKAHQSLLVELPGERMLVQVARVLNPDVVIVEITEQPLGKAHRYAKGEFVPCERTITEMGETVWRSFVPRATPKPEPQKTPRKRKVKRALKTG